MYTNIQEHIPSLVIALFLWRAVVPLRGEQYSIQTFIQACITNEQLLSLEMLLSLISVGANSSVSVPGSL